ncbi:unnamed protein product, partial [Ectocarpus fasciculatus]
LTEKLSCTVHGLTTGNPLQYVPYRLRSILIYHQKGSFCLLKTTTLRLLLCHLLTHSSRHSFHVYEPISYSVVCRLRPRRFSSGLPTTQTRTSKNDILAYRKNVFQGKLTTVPTQT